MSGEKVQKRALWALNISCSFSGFFGSEARRQESFREMEVGDERRRLRNRDKVSFAFKAREMGLAPPWIESEDLPAEGFDAQNRLNSRLMDLMEGCVHTDEDSNIFKYIVKSVARC